MGLTGQNPTGRPARKPAAARPSPRQSLGRLGESLAAERLAAAGYEVVGRNERTSEGEIDLVARQDGQWVFVEVRTRRGNRFGTPEESITPRKRDRLIRTGLAYLSARELADAPWRVDVVAVELSNQGTLLRVEIIENAVSGAP